MRITFYPYLRTKSKLSKNGTLYIRVTAERNHFYINTGEIIPAASWSQKTKKVLPSNPQAELFNDLLQSKIAELHTQTLRLKLSGAAVNFETVKALLLPEAAPVAAGTFAALVQDYCSLNGLKPGRVKQFGTTISLWQREAMPVNFYRLCEKDIVRLRDKLAATSKHNTVISHLKRIKSIINYCMKRKAMDSDPMAFIKLGAWESDIKFLTVEDLQKIEQVRGQFSEKIQNVIDMFLFACYTGLRYSDVVKLTAENVVMHEGELYLNYRQQKTNKKELLPLALKAAELLPQVIGRHYTNQYLNRELKKLNAATGIQQEISFHLARHTFATIGINKGISLDAMQAFLGHSDIKTTQIYAHLLLPAKRREMAKFDAL